MLIYIYIHIHVYIYIHRYYICRANYHRARVELLKSVFNPHVAM